MNIFIDFFSDNNTADQINLFKGALSGLRQSLASESPLKMMKNDFISS